MIRTVGFPNVWCTKFDVLHTNNDVLISNVQLDVSTKIIDDFFIRTDTNVLNDTLHAGKLIVS